MTDEDDIATTTEDRSPREELTAELRLIRAVCDEYVLHHLAKGDHGQISNVDNRYQTITVSSTTNVRVGDAFTIAGVEAAHHITKSSTGQLTRRARTTHISSARRRTHRENQEHPMSNHVAAAHTALDIAITAVRLDDRERIASLERDLAHARIEIDDLLSRLEGVAPDVDGSEEPTVRARRLDGAR